MIPAYRLYGAAISLYTGKVRAYLRYRNIPFVEESGSPEIFERVGFRMIPVVHTPDDQLIQDTTVIIDYFEEQFAKAGLGGPSVHRSIRPVRRSGWSHFYSKSMAMSGW
jgi:glutathione S-transferase